MESLHIVKAPFPHIYRRLAGPGITVVALALTLAIAGCGSGSHSARLAAVEKSRLTIGVIQAVSAGGLYVAEQRGYFAAEGLRVKIVPVQSAGQAIPLLLNGTLDATFGNYVSYFSAEAHGTAKLHILAEGYLAGPRGLEVMALPGSGITSVPDLRGKLIGVNLTSDVSEVVIDAALTAHHVPVSSVRLTVVPFPDMNAALKAHRIDAAWLTDPYLAEARVTLGAQPVIDSDQGVTRNLPIAGAFTTSAWARKYPKTAAAFTRAMERGQAYAGQHRAAVEQGLLAFTKISSGLATKITMGGFPTSTDPARLQRVAGLMYQYGLIKQRLDVSPMLRG